MTTPEEEALIEAVTTAYRARDPDGSVRGHPSFYDLDASGRREAFERTVVQRRIEAGFDAQRLSSTGNAVLARIRRGSP